jgi:hypothetical protein
MAKVKDKVYQPKKNPIVTSGLYTAFVASFSESRRDRRDKIKEKNINLR